MKERTKISNQDRKLERYKRENDTLKNKLFVLEIENKKLSDECSALYDYFFEVQKLEDIYNEEIAKLRELKKRYAKEVNSYIALKKDYKKAMKKFLDSLE